MQKRIVTYQEFGKLLDLLVAKLEAYKFDYVYGPPRGGLPIAVHLSHHLDIELVDRDYTCPSCNTHLDRDENASKNLYQIGAHLWNTGEILDSKSYMDLFQ